MTSLHESQAQLQLAQGALEQQREAARRLRRSQLEAPAPTVPSSSSGTVMEQDRQESRRRAESEETEAPSTNSVLWYQTPGLESLQCKYGVAVTEVVELKAQLKALREKLAQRDEGTSEEEPGRAAQLQGVEEQVRSWEKNQNLEEQVRSWEKSCREGRGKVLVLLVG